MAKNRVNKSAMIREFMAKNPEASVDSIKEALKDSGVSKANIYQVRNSQRKEKHTEKMACLTATPVNEVIDDTVARGLTVQDLTTVAAVSKSLGGMCNLKKAISALETLTTS